MVNDWRPATGFDDSPDAIATILELLANQLPQSAVFIAEVDHTRDALRIADLRGSRSFGLSPGDVIPLDGPSADDTAGAASLVPALTSRAARSFVGIPLQIGDGEHAATLYAISDSTERFAHDDVELLTVMARVIAHQLERERTESDLIRRHELLRRSNRRLRVDAATDPLTGLANRRSFEQALAREWKVSRRGLVESSLMLIDLDDFKSVNDRYSHSVGDEVLVATARAIRDNIRADELAARRGGDEFAVVCTLDREQDLVDLAERLARAVAEARLRACSDVLPTASVGYVVWRPGESCDSFMARVDQELHRSKKAAYHRLHGSAG
jgi:diguanylate cyclase (GGDEF)-like protein